MDTEMLKTITFLGVFFIFCFQSCNRIPLGQHTLMLGSEGIYFKFVINSCNKKLKYTSNYFPHLLYNNKSIIGFIPPIITSSNWVNLSRESIHTT